MDFRNYRITNPASQDTHIAAHKAPEKYDHADCLTPVMATRSHRCPIIETTASTRHDLPNPKSRDSWLVGLNMQGAVAVVVIIEHGHTGLMVSAPPRIIGE